ncbi:methionine--tRNA ligase [Patescibacteria group bacterium]|nr:methionine--tRNA ligase [Patescibacteria group bacterium]
MRYFVSTSIPYVNDQPHIGYLWEAILADVFVRFQRERGNDVFFLSGVDENGLKIYRSAQSKGWSVVEFVQETSNQFFKLKKEFNLSYDGFIRTSSPQHQAGVKKFWQMVQKDIYPGYYQGWYCVSCEDYFTLEERPDRFCPIHHKRLEELKEENYFFRLTKYLNQIEDIIKQDKIKIRPAKRKKEVLKMIKSDQIKDLSVSRSAKRSQGWGIKVPDDPDQVVYVWFDALINYLSGLGFGQEEGSGNFEKYWQEAGAIVHFIGKDIFKFHTIYWPAMLLAAGLRLPDEIIIHDFFTVEGEKMSKTLGNVIKPEELLTRAGVEPSRYYFSTQPNQFEDSDFSLNHFDAVCQNELKNEVGNLVSRIFGLLKKGPAKIKLDQNLFEKEINQTSLNYFANFNQFDFRKAFAVVFDLVKNANKFIEEKKLWQGGSEADFKTLVQILFKLAEFYRPVMPEASEKIRLALDLTDLNSESVFINRRNNFEPLFE